MTDSCRLVLGCGLLLLPAAGWSEGVAIRVETEGFGASAADIGAVCRSAADALTAGWTEVPAVKLVVVRGNNGPFTPYRRNGNGEAVLQLDTGGTYWSQYSYQFAHELCHVLCGSRDGYRGNLWFEETLCETASLYCMRRMGVEWRVAPPYPNWRDYAPSLEDYVRDVIRGRGRYPELVKSGLPAFYRQHRERLESEPCDRELNGAIAVVLLGLFECEPRQWEAIRWLNTAPAPKGESFAGYLRRWHDAAPAAHRKFIAGIAELHGVAW